MTLPPLVTTKAALDAYLSSEGVNETVLEMQVPTAARDLITTVDSNGIRYLVHRSDSAGAALIVFAGKNCLEVLPPQPAVVLSAFQRAHRVALAGGSSRLRVSTGWSAFHHNNLVTYFTGPREHGGYRWICEIHPSNSGDFFFSRVTTSREPITLQSYRPSHDLYHQATRDWSEACAAAGRRFARRSSHPPAHVMETVDLEAATFGAVVGGQTETAWIDALTREQRSFLERDGRRSVKLRGPAGTGKTLLLQLKALRESRQGPDHRCLFVTHSWAVAEQIDAGLRRLSETPDDLDRIEIFPLLSIAQDVLPSERQGRGFELLGEDSLEGKLKQLGIIRSLVETAAVHDWVTYASRCGEAFTARVLSGPGSLEQTLFVVDLMYEFACVISANGILPGVNAQRRYFSIHRMPWMMQLETDGERSFVLSVYSALVAQLGSERLMTSDQLVNDFLNYLETFAWNLRRTELGYDTIFVDELHLFNEQERLALTFLSRDPGSHPAMFMALDPRQSPSEIYTGVRTGSSANEGSGEADEAIGVFEAMDLTTVHRFSEEILTLVKHINAQYPSLDLDHDWDIRLDKLTTSRPDSGSVPELRSHATFAEERDAVAEEVMGLLRQLSAKERVAVLLLDPGAVAKYEDLAVTGSSVHVIRGRDDVGSLQYSRRAVVLSPAEYVAGLQFTSVVVAGFPRDPERRVNVGHELRRLLSILYLAASRATASVSFHVNAENGGVPDILETAIRDGVVKHVQP